MLTQSNSVPPNLCMRPAQVWPVLTVEIQTHIIRLMAVLASNWATAEFQSQTFQNQNKEKEEMTDAFKPD